MAFLVAQGFCLSCEVSLFPFMVCFIMWIERKPKLGCHPRSRWSMLIISKLSQHWERQMSLGWKTSWDKVLSKTTTSGDQRFCGTSLITWHPVHINNSHMAAAR